MVAFKDVSLPAAGIEHYGQPRQYDSDLQQCLNDMKSNLKAILNGGIRFQDNINCVLVTFTSSAMPDAENTISHTLGKVPVGYLVYGRDKAGTIYDGTTAWTGSKIYLKCNVASVATKIIIF